ncbi:MAG: leucyl/phenylalanyl-tRNA--protein transferase [Spirochaetales bacterium]|jgi:leucyl/phenylalanyl-tRNA--protein transferase|nr:leucyl/phenylalanyl-tRNA--protein transferase [Spirochaetales bacterium]
MPRSGGEPRSETSAASSGGTSAADSGPDPAFPYFDENRRFSFPSPADSKGSIIAIGGNLSPGMLLSAYEQGIFPWYNPGEPILWQSPDPRFILFPDRLHVSASMRKVFARGEFTLSVNQDFAGVIQGCSKAYRPGQGGTWITKDIIKGYTELHKLGYVISAESWKDGKLSGGCYGVHLGKVFCGESMFAKVSNASKAAFLNLARMLFDNGVEFIDCQVPSDHLRSLGGVEMSRSEFLVLLKKTLSK